MKNKSIKLSLMIPYLSVILLATACKKDDLSAENTAQTAPTSSETLALDAPTATTTSTTSTTTRYEAENYASMSGVGLDACSEGGKNVGSIQAGDWMKYTISTPAAGSYKLNFRVGSYAGGGQFQVKNAAGTVLATVTAPKTGGYQTYATVSVNANLAAGSQTIQLYAVSAGYNINWFEVVGGTTSGGSTTDGSSSTTTPTAPTAPTTSTSGALGSATIGSNILFREAFEGSTPWSGFGKEWGSSYSFTTTTTPALQGAKAGRFELRDGDPMYRSEVRFPSSYNGKDRWFAFSVYWPSNGMQTDSKSECFHQAHQTSATSAPVCLLIKNGRMLAEVNGQVFAGALGQGGSLTKTMDIGAVPKDKWVRFVIHYKFSYNTDGQWQIWQNGQQVLNYSGKTIYPPAITSNLPTFKLGIYKWVWNGTGTSDSKLRIMYVDDVRVGNENSSLSSM